MLLWKKLLMQEAGAVPTSWTFTSSTNYATAGVPTQAKLSDGSAATFWASSGVETIGNSNFLRADFGSVKTLSAVHYRAATSAGWGPSYTNGATIQHSMDGTTWTTATTIADAVDTADRTFTFPAPVLARYVRLHSRYGDAGNSSTYLAAGEFRFT